MKKSAIATVGLALIVLVAMDVWYWLCHDPTESASRASWAAAEHPPAVALPTIPAASEPRIQYPIEVPVTAASASAPAMEIDAASVLTELFGRKSVLGLFQLDDFSRRVVATVDNLGRSHAPARLWPMNPADGRFLTERHGDAELISADNGLRYTPYVLLIETVGLHEMVAAYSKLYPSFQKAYMELGYPNGSFNDRVLEVIDQLVATPEVNSTTKVRGPSINGPMQPLRPWVLYEFEDPALQSLTAGQKILLRTGPVNERRLKAKLAELRRLLATGVTTE